jgi:hypothetical protein
MKFFKDFFRFKKNKQILEQQAPPKDEVIGGKTEFEKRASKKGKQNLKLDYTEKATDPIWQGKNYDEVWKPAVEGALDNPETYDKVLNYLKTYAGQDAVTVKKIIQKEEQLEKQGKGSLKAAIQKLATDGKIGPFHTIMRKAVERATGKPIEVLQTKQAKFVKPEFETPKLNLQTVDPGPKSEVLNKKMIINVIDRETKKPILTAKYLVKDEDGEDYSKGNVDDKAEFSFQIIGPSKFNVKISADEYEPFDKEFSFDKDSFSTLTVEGDVVRKTVSLKPIKKPTTVSLKPIKSDKEFFQKPRMGLKSTTGAGSKNKLGELEKQQIELPREITVTSAAAAGSEGLLDLKYPLMKGKSTSLGSFSLSGPLKTDGPTSMLIKMNDEYDMDRWVHIFSTYYNPKYKVQYYGFKLPKGQNEKNIKIGALRPGPMKINMVVTGQEVDITPYTKQIKKDGRTHTVMTNAQCEEFVKFLKDQVKPFADTKWGGPAFSSTSQTFDVKKAETA